MVQDQLGHSTVVLTADTYTSVLTETARTAEHTAALLFPVRQHVTSGTHAARRARKSLPAKGLDPALKQA